MNTLFQDELRVINIGLESFHRTIVESDGSSRQLDWAPPGEGDVALSRSLGRLVGNELLSNANETAFRQYLSAHPTLVDLVPAKDALTGLGERTLLHAGPPIEWGDMCGPMKGAIVGAMLFESWAQNESDAIEIIESGEIKFSPCHHYGAVGPMSGVISPSMDLWVVENGDRGNRAFSNLNEGLGKVLRFGANSIEVLDRLRWMQSTLAPAIRHAIQNVTRNGAAIEIKPIMAQALHMGDEVHNRNVAASALFLKGILPHLIATASHGDLVSIIDFVNANDHFFLNISMAACKSMLDAAADVPFSSMVTAMSRNGVEFGIRTSGSGDEWFVAPAPLVDGLFFPGYSSSDAARDLGDSAITETAGVGGFAMAAAPAIVQFVGGSPAAAVGYTREMMPITLGRNAAFSLPQLDFTGTPAGIDAVRVVDNRTPPIINTGIAHRDAGVGQVGAGITRAPMACFYQAVAALASKLPETNDGK